MYLRQQPQSEQLMEVLMVRAGTDLGIGLVALMMTGVFGIFGSAPSGVFSLILSYIALMAVLAIGRFVITLHSISLRLDANFFAQQFNWVNAPNFLPPMTPNQMPPIVTDLHGNPVNIDPNHWPQ